MKAMAEAGETGAAGKFLTRHPGIEAFELLLPNLETIFRGKHLGRATLAEYVPAQYEINQRHVADPLAAADYAILLKRPIKESIQQHGIRDFFVPKRFEGESGDGMRLHLSLAEPGAARRVEHRVPAHERDRYLAVG